MEQRLQRMAGSIGALTELTDGELAASTGSPAGRAARSPSSSSSYSALKNWARGTGNGALERCREEAFAALQTVPSWSDLWPIP